MIMPRWDGPESFPRLRTLFESLARDFPTWSDWMAAEEVLFPAVNVWDDESNLFLEAEIPGLRMEDLEISVMGSQVALQGRRAEADLQGVSVLRQERGTGAFSRTIELPVEVDANRVEATLSHGVLQVTLPKSEEARPRKIEVKVAGK